MYSFVFAHPPSGETSQPREVTGPFVWQDASNFHHERSFVRGGNVCRVSHET